MDPAGDSSKPGEARSSLSMGGNFLPPPKVALSAGSSPEPTDHDDDLQICPVDAPKYTKKQERQDKKSCCM